MRGFTILSDSVGQTNKKSEGTLKKEVERTQSSGLLLAFLHFSELRVAVGCPNLLLGGVFCSQSKIHIRTTIVFYVVEVKVFRCFQLRYF